MAMGHRIATININKNVIQLKSLLQQGGGAGMSLQQIIPKSCRRLHQTWLPASICNNTQFIPFHRDCTATNSLSRKKQSPPHHFVLQSCHQVSSFTSHSFLRNQGQDMFVGSCSLSANSILKCNDHLGLFNQRLSVIAQIRSVHSQTAKRRVSRNFSNNSSTPSEQSGNEGKDTEEDDKKMSLYQRFKKTYKEHGKVLVIVHCMTSAVWFGSFYAAARGGVDLVPLLESWNLSERVISPFRSGGLGDVALAYLMYKLATPARYTVTIGGTNMAIRYLRKGGKMEPVAKEDTLREMYREGKADLKTKGIKTRWRLGVMRGSIQGRIRTRLRNMRGRMRRRRKRSIQDRK